MCNISRQAVKRTINAFENGKPLINTSKIGNKRASHKSFKNIDDINKAYDLLVSGYTQEMVEKEYNCHTVTIRKYCVDKKGTTAKNHNAKVEKTGIHTVYPFVTPLVVPNIKEGQIKRKRYCEIALEWSKLFIIRMVFIDHKRVWIYGMNRYIARQ